MKSEEEIQAAHDRMVALILGEIPHPFGDGAEISMKAAADVLCWVLDHDHNHTFADNINRLDLFMAERGKELTRK